jgi:peptidoglycan hydrolase-like protein with peptidoglycan-binding domain
MRHLLCKSGLILAALAGASVPAVAAPQSSQTTTTHKSPGTAHKKSGTLHASTTKKPGPAPNTDSPSTKKASSHTKASSRGKTKKVRGQDAPTPDRINEIQEALASKGAFSGTPTGKWDDSTVEAMRKFQSSHGLEPTGKLDALTLQKLGLGSQTAGLAAPVAPPNSINRLHNTTSSPEEPQNKENR